MTAPGTSALLEKPPPPVLAPPTTGDAGWPPSGRPRGAGADDPRGWFALALAIAALALLSSVTSLGNGFAYDDRWIIVENRHIHTLERAWHFFAETYWPNVRGAALYRPLTILLYAVQWVVGDGAPLVFHLANVALYVAASVLVLWFALLCLPRGAAWIAAALFAVHPVHVEAVGNVVGQSELWTALVMVGATALYLRDRRDGLPLRRSTARTIVELYVLGMLIKENAIVLPALLAAAEWLLVDDRRPARERARAVFALAAWMGLFAALFLWVRVSILAEIGGDVMHPSLMHLSAARRALLMLGIVPEFGRLFLWPARLFADYSPRQLPVHTTWHPDVLAGAMILAGALALFLLLRRRAPAAAFGLAWLAISLAPVSNVLIPTGILLAERTLLVPSLGVALAAANAAPWILGKLKPVPRTVRLAAAGAFALLLTLGASRSAERQYAWKDGETVFLTLASDAPLNFKAHYTLGGLLFEKKRAVEAEREWRYAIALMPGYYGVYADLAHKYREAHVCQAAIPRYEEALAIEPALPLSRAGLVACRLELAQWRRARAESRAAIADGFDRRFFIRTIEIADSALVANDSLDPTNKWRGKVAKPRK